MFGTLVTQDQRFIAFEIASSDRIQVERWEDVTAARISITTTVEPAWDGAH